MSNNCSTEKQRPNKSHSHNENKKNLKKNKRKLYFQGFVVGLLEGAAIGMVVTALTGGFGILTIPIFALLMAVKKTKDRYFTFKRVEASLNNPAKNVTKWILGSLFLDTLLGIGSGFGLLHTFTVTLPQLIGILAGSFGLGVASSLGYEGLFVGSGKPRFFKKNTKNTRAKIFGIIGAAAAGLVILGGGLATGGLFLLIPAGAVLVGWSIGHILPDSRLGQDITTGAKDFSSGLAACGVLVVLVFIAAPFTGGLSLPLSLLIAGSAGALLGGVLPFAWKWDMNYLWSCITECRQNKTKIDNRISGFTSSGNKIISAMSNSSSPLVSQSQNQRKRDPLELPRNNVVIKNNNPTSAQESKLLPLEDKLLPVSRFSITK